MIHRYKCAVSGELKPPNEQSCIHCHCACCDHVSDEERRAGMREDVMAMAERVSERLGGWLPQYHYTAMIAHRDACREFAKELER